MKPPVTAKKTFTRVVTVWGFLFSPFPI